jgi:hypothetical protein
VRHRPTGMACATHAMVRREQIIERPGVVVVGQFGMPDREAAWRRCARPRPSAITSAATTGIGGHGIDGGAIAGNHTSRKGAESGTPGADPRTYDRNCVSDLRFASRVRRKPGWRCICPAIGLARKLDLSVRIRDECNKFGIAFRHHGLRSKSSLGPDGQTI